MDQGEHEIDKLDWGRGAVWGQAVAYGKVSITNRQGLGLESE